MMLKKLFVFFSAVLIVYQYSNAQACRAKEVFSQVEINCVPYGSHLYCVQLEVSERFDANGNPLTHIWLLGDGQIKPGPYVEHCYSNYGEYDVRLVSTKIVGNITMSDTTHYPLNVGEVALIQEIKEDRSQYFFDGSGAFINDDYQIMNYYWDFGDGHFACDMLVSNRYTKAGEYEVKLIVEGVSKSGDQKIICGSKKIIIR